MLSLRISKFRAVPKGLIDELDLFFAVIKL
jgi:hypothetical protein